MADEPPDIFTTGSGSEETATLQPEINGSLGNLTCVSRKQTSFLLFCTVPSLSIIINMVVLVAVAMDSRRLLRQSRVYAHVSSTLIANVIFSIFALIQILSLYFNFEGHDDDPRPGYKGAVKRELAEWWAFRKSFLYGMYIIMCGNIGLLISAIRSSTCIALRSAAGAVHIRPSEPNKFQKTILRMQSSRMSSKSHDTAVPSSRVTRRRRSYVLITLLWVVPIGYVVAPAIGWSCARHCTCLSSCFPQDMLYDPPVRGCSRAFPPMSNSWLALTVAIWAAGLIGVSVMLKRSVVILRRMRKKHQPPEQSVAMTTAATGSEAAIKDDVFLSDNNCQGMNSRVTSVTSDILEHDSKMKSIDEKTDAFDATTDDADGAVKQTEAVRASSRTYRSHKNRSVSRSSVPSGNGEEVSQKRDRNQSTSSRASIFTGIFTSEGRSLLRRRSKPVAKSISHILEISSNLKYIIWITVAFGFCTAPPMLYLSADMLFINLKLNMIVLNTCLLFPFIYCFICPFLLARCLPGVKSSLQRLIFRFCTYTTVKRTGSTQ